MSDAIYTKDEATRLLDAEGLDWTSAAADVSDTLILAGWPEHVVDHAMRWLA